MVTFGLVFAAAVGCQSSRLQGASISIWAADLRSPDPTGYNLVFGVQGDSGCQAQPPTLVFTLDGAPLAYADCLALAGPFFEDRAFTIGVEDGADKAEAVVADMFPGLHATVSDPAGAKVTPGSEFVVTIPQALQSETPLIAGFTYVDNDDPSYLGDATRPTGTAGAAHVLAPQHLGHFILWISMSLKIPADFAKLPKGRIVSCSGVDSCQTWAAADIGPLAVEVVSP